MKKLYVKFSVAISLLLTLSFAFNLTGAAQTTDDVGKNNLPTSYSSVDQGYITSVKDQGNTGTCWAHATMAACEASLIKNNGYPKDLNLSELNLAYCAYHTMTDKLGLFDSQTVSLMDYIYSGGDFGNAMITLANWNGVVSENANHSQYASEKLFMINAQEFDVYNKESQYCYDEAHLTNSYSVDGDDINTVKENILKFAAGATHINANCYNEETFVYYSPYYQVLSGYEHGVTIVGWDDSFPKENCNVDGNMPQNDGAWLIKNSWGTDCGMDGYMWVSYEDSYVVNDGVTFFELESADNYTYNYGYDDLTGKYTLNVAGVEVGNDVKMANVFTAQGDNEQLKAVSFYTTNENLNFEAYIYTGLTQSTSPIEGLPVACVSGNIPLKGYHTVKLDKPISLEKGEKFSVVIRLYSDNPDTEVFVNIDMQDEHQELKSNENVKISDYGESFYCMDDLSWVDLKTVLKGNMRIKAFTGADSKDEPVKDEFSEYGGYTRDQLIDMLKEDTKKTDDYIYTSYTYSRDSIYTLIKLDGYAEDVINNSDLFLAVELFGLHNKLNSQMNNMEPYTMAEDLKYYYKEITGIKSYDSVKGWDEFISSYNEAVEASKQGLINDSNYGDYYEKARTAYINFMDEAIANGHNFSYLQNYGDINNDSMINMVDVTQLQKILAALVTDDFYSCNNSDVNGDGEINLVDVTTIQKYICRLNDHFAVYDNNFNGIDGFTDDISKSEAEEYLNSALKNAEEWQDFPYMDQSENVDTIRVKMIYRDAKFASENADRYKPNELLFKARNLLRCFSGGGKG
ncbi:MAG: lectin like domain-containing protein [Clostridia bacterium]|nr:lectin like domain-containing protein [Clostridia bacterium]